MARSRSLVKCLLITHMFMLLLICLDNPKAAMGYDLLLAAVNSQNIRKYRTIKIIAIL